MTVVPESLIEYSVPFAPPPEGLNSGDDAGDDIATTEHLPINLDGGLPSGAG